METKIFDLLEKYLDVYSRIRQNRKDIVAKAKDNRKERKTLAVILVDLEKEATKIRNGDKSLYRLCMDRYGKIDEHYHRLYKLFFEQFAIPRPRKKGIDKK